MRFKPTVLIPFLIALSGLASNALAALPMTVGTMTLVGVSGLTRMEFPTDTSGAVVRPIIYAGMVNNSGCDTSANAVCDTCAKAGPVGEKFYPCNRSSIYPSMKLHFDLTTTTSSTTYGSGDIFVKGGTNTTGLSVTGNYTAGTKTISVDVTWDQICGALSNSGCNSSETPSRATFSVGIGPASTSVDKFDIDIVFSYVDVNNTARKFTEACAEDGTLVGGAPTDGTNYGACFYKALRGDGKVYINPITNASTYPVYQGSVNYGGLEVFYAEGTVGDYDNIVRSITTSSAQHTSFDIPTGGTSVTENRVNGLNNGSQYCFVVANKDLTGNIFYYAPVVDTAPPAGANVASETICAVPDLVVGLLDDKSCFIATAAFGSDMAPEVQTFRNFRNQFLLNSSWGRTFVKTYYKFSPPLANFIAEHETLRMVARGALWPVLMFVKISLEWGVIWAALAASLLTLAAAEAFRRLRSFKIQRKAS